MTKKGGPYPHLRVDFTIKATQGAAVMELVLGQGFTFRQAGARLGLTTTTAWRRYWWLMDWTLPHRLGTRDGPIPPQRGTRACPRGRPYLPTVDGPDGPFRHLTKGNQR
ncbi:hypothetical protein [Streptomyces sp. NPDC058108]|uniref:hypothetical protein n=1 Tax=Streptomyces sp. NPDC058108 TaxID=3346344 RepID=UPI0036E78372